jgi:DNA polymerase-3 subunit beta
MKISVLQENLAHGLNIVSRAVSPRSTLPVLANVLVATDEGRLRLSATNLELGITCWIGAKIMEEGSTTVPARTFTELVSTLADKQVDMSLTVRTQTLNMQCGSSNTDLKCIDSQEFPPMPTLDLTDGIQINVADFKEMIQQVAFAASTDEARPVLTGVLITVDGELVTLAAADGFRLSVRKAALSSGVPRPVSATIPARALTELARIAGDGDQAITMVLPPGRGQVIFHLKDVELVAAIGRLPRL